MILLHGKLFKNGAKVPHISARIRVTNYIKVT